MEIESRNGMSAPAPQGTARPNITIPAPEQRMVQANVDDQAELERKYKNTPLAPTRYLREKASGQIHRWSEDFGARSDLVEPYNPTIRELVKFGENVYEMMQWGITPKQLWGSGATAQQISDAQVSVEDMLAIGITPEALIKLGHNIQLEQSDAQPIVVPPTPPSAPAVAAKATAPIIKTPAPAPPAPAPAPPAAE